MLIIKWRDCLKMCDHLSVSLSICSGDSGGPLTISETEGIRVLIGVNSFTVEGNCADPHVPAGFGRVTGKLSTVRKSARNFLHISNFMQLS